jgi:CheY-like chemotaxis protein
MTLSLRNRVRGWLFDGSRRNEKESQAQKSHRSMKTILFVDDEPSILSMRRLVFEALGYSVLTATGGQDALEVFAMYPVDAVILDYLMPGMDGEETARRMRKMRSDIPIILSSGCLTVPKRVLKVVNAAVEKAARPEALIEALAQQLTLCPAASCSAAVDAQSQGLVTFGMKAITP